jgi:hypothetical protein
VSGPKVPMIKMGRRATARVLAMAADDVQLPDLEVIQRYSIAVRGASAPRDEVIAALRADLDWLTSSSSRPAPSRVPAKASAKAPKATAKSPGKAPAPAKRTARRTSSRTSPTSSSEA